MLVFETKIKVKNLTAKEITDFLLNPADAFYQQWWPNIHLQFHAQSIAGKPLEDVVYLDDYFEHGRYKMRGMVVNAVPGKEIVWQAKEMIPLPVKLFLQLEDDNGDVYILHTIKIGYGGLGSILDPVFSSFFSKDFVREMEAHIKTEFPKLRDLLLKSGDL